MPQDTFKLFIIDEPDHGNTLAELFSRAMGTGKNFSCKNLTLSEAWKKFVNEEDVANGILIHGSLQEGHHTGIELASKLKTIGYRVNIFTTGGGRKFELNGYTAESEVEGFTHNDIEVILELIKAASGSGSPER